MGDQMRIRFFTRRYRPERGWTVTVRSTLNWEVDQEGQYINGAWVFVFQPQRIQFKFILDRAFWQDGNNIPITDPGASPFNYYDKDVRFQKPNLQDGVLPDPENGIVSRTFFEPNLNENAEYDVLVIGSGAGGGILADATSDAGLSTLVLEAGSYLFPTHIANLPRAHKTGRFDKHVWGLYYDFWSRPFYNEGDSVYSGGYGYNLGGRSIFWGGLIPRMRPYEFVGWPRDVQDALLGDYYCKSEALMKKGDRASEYQETTKKFMRDLLGDDFLVEDAPMAVQRLGSPDKRQISAGMFSTADLLMESRATEGQVGKQNLIINLNHSVRRIETDGNRRAVRVVAYDRLGRQERGYKARSVVLAAGALESAVIAQRSGLNDPSRKAGQGISDHQIWFTHFGLPPTSKLYTIDASSKIVIQHKAATENKHRYNCVIELGADFNQGRYVDPDILEEHNSSRQNRQQLCEIVFLTPGSLKDENYVRPGDGDDGRPMRIHMQRCDDSNDLLPEMEDVKNRILNALGAVALQGEDVNKKLVEADVGGVAHEVGSLRMANNEADGVVDPNLRFWSYDNIYACDLSVFPTSPAANPTLALGGLALRLADHLRSQ